MMDANEFRSRFFDKVSDDEANEWADRWVKNAEALYDDSMSEIKSSAKLYIAMRNAVRELGANAIAVDCIVSTIQVF
ncbi:hypothetical protein [Vulcanisaeta sp. JCM 16161]|uniref:hypothetical protein n=1 Tax=Vulcanisaeta sp. JCM 16161 TaxID=1295372 RepID=UPI001FB29F3A|nr:hypothetical protein [Vulcanisaeta sp. JCM 16161]